MFNFMPIVAGEVFEGYLTRLALINGFPNIETFCRFYCAAATNIDLPFNRKTTLLFPDFSTFGPLCSFVFSELNRLFNKTIPDIINQNTLFPIACAFLNKETRAFLPFSSFISNPLGIYESVRSNRFPVNNHYIDNKLFQAVALSELRYCPSCMSQDMNNHGFPIARIAHNIPGVSVCHEHKVPLISFPGGVPDMNKPYWQSNPCPAPNNAEYARFVNEFLTGCERDSLYLGRYWTLLHSLFDYSFLSDTQLYSAVCSQGYINSYLNTWESAAMMFCLVLFVFGSYDNFSDYIRGMDTNSMSSTAQAVVHMYTGDHYTVLNAEEQFPSNAYSLHISLRHNDCNTTYDTTLAHFIDGNFCPVCSTAHTREETSQKLADTSDGYYKLIGIKDGDCLIQTSSNPEERLHFPIGRLWTYMLSEHCIYPRINQKCQHDPGLRPLQTTEFIRRARILLSFMEGESVISLNTLKDMAACHSLDCLYYWDYAGGLLDEIISGLNHCKKISPQRIAIKTEVAS